MPRPGNYRPSRARSAKRRAQARPAGGDGWEAAIAGELHGQAPYRVVLAGNG
jgi:hypothetical protein